MTNKITKIPQIRFNDFTEDWEQRKLGEVVKINGRIGFRGYTQADIIRKEDGGILAFSPTNIINNKLDFNVKNTYITKDKYYESPEIMVKNGDILFVKTGSTLGKSASVSNLNEEATINPQIVILRATSYFISEFISSYLISNNILKQVAQTRIGGAVPTLTETEIKRFQISAPKGKEQQKIGTLFKQLDDTIALHQREYDLLKLLKQGYLQKMIPRKENNESEVRFENFKETWKNRKIKEIFKVTRGHVLASTEVAEEQSKVMPYPVYSSQTKNDGLMGYYKEYLFDTAITWTTDGANAGTVNYREGKFYSTNVNGVLLSDDGYTNEAIAEILNKEAWKWVSHVGNPKLMNNIMEDITICTPQSIEEQNKLSIFFKQLDNIITLHHQNLDNLKQMKKSLLQKMFV